MSNCHKFVPHGTGYATLIVQAAFKGPSVQRVGSFIWASIEVRLQWISVAESHVRDVLRENAIAVRMQQLKYCGKIVR